MGEHGLGARAAAGTNRDLVSRGVENPHSSGERGVGPDPHRERRAGREGDLIEIDVVGPSQTVAQKGVRREPGRRPARLLEERANGRGLHERGIVVVSATDLQAVQLVAQVAVERQRGPTDPLARAIGRRVGDRPGDPHRHFGPGVGIGLDQPVVAYRLRRGREQRVVGVEMHHDGVAGLRE